MSTTVPGRPSAWVSENLGCSAAGACEAVSPAAVDLIVCCANELESIGSGEVSLKLTLVKVFVWAKILELVFAGLARFAIMLIGKAICFLGRNPKF